MFSVIKTKRLQWLLSAQGKNERFDKYDVFFVGFFGILCIAAADHSSGQRKRVTYKAGPFPSDRI